MGRDERNESALQELQAEVARLRESLDAERRHADQWRQVAEERRVALERLRQMLPVRAALRAGGVVLPPARRARRRAQALTVRGRRAGAALRVLPSQLTASRREHALHRALAALPPAPTSSRSVSIVILTRDGVDRLRAALAALRTRTAHPHTRIIVVDNGSGPPTRDFLAAQADVDVVRFESNQTFSAANNAAAARSDSDVVCFLNDDVQVLTSGWLPRMLDALAGDVVAVGAQLVYPRRPLGRTRTPDLSVQHLGIEFVPVPGDVPRAVNVGAGRDPDPSLPPREVAAATAACLAVDRKAFAAAGGFDEGYVYGAEDVDLCWRLRRAGGRIAVVPSAVALHHEGATRLTDDATQRADRQRRNWARLADRFGPALTRAVALDRLHARRVLSSRPLQVGITVTREVAAAGYGDRYTAHELGDALTSLGWRVHYLQRHGDAWYDLPAGLDVLVVLLDTFDLRRVDRRGLTTVAWVRNWTRRWLSHPWFGDYDLVLASSATSARLVAEHSRHRPVIFPLATNPGRFTEPADPRRAGAVLTANHWGDDRGAPALVRSLPELALYGKGWERVPGVRTAWRGQVPYERLPGVYARAELVVDQTAGHTAPYGAVNARVFDALAAGALVATDNAEGARELFGDRLPVWRDPDDLARISAEAAANPQATRERVDKLRATVLAEHTWEARARTLQGLLVERAQRRSFVLKTSVSDRAAAPRWGDWHLAWALARELAAAGHPVAVQTAAEWAATAGSTADVSVHLKGRSVATRTAGQVHVIWNISHPEELTVEECDAADLVCVASRRFAEALRTRTSTPVAALLQATDERRFRPYPPEARYRHEVAFVGNSRSVLRPVVRDALEAGLPPAIYGSAWERFVDPGLLRAVHVDNAELPRLYSSVTVLLNDHWEGMRREGFVSNRIFDALACATAVVSDDLPELAQLFGDAVTTYPGGAQALRAAVEGLLADPELRRRRAEHGRRIVLDEHTFAVRARQLNGYLDQLGAS